MGSVGALAQVGDLEALPVNDGRASFIVLLLANPHLLEGGQRGQDGTADPDGVFPLRGSDDLQGYSRYAGWYEDIFPHIKRLNEPVPLCHKKALAWFMKSCSP